MQNYHNPQHLVGTTGQGPTHTINSSAIKQETESVSQEQLVARLKKLMKMNLKNYCYLDAIFFADKIMHL